MSTSVVPESLRLAIQSSYSLLLEKQGFKARSGQRQMIAAISRSLCDAETNGLSLMEAGTGVGKSVVPHRGGARAAYRGGDR